MIIQVGRRARVTNTHREKGLSKAEGEELRKTAGFNFINESEMTRIHSFFLSLSYMYIYISTSLLSLA